MRIRDADPESGIFFDPGSGMEKCGSGITCQIRNTGVFQDRLYLPSTISREMWYQVRC
jgi:hypothetical protein